MKKTFVAFGLLSLMMWSCKESAVPRVIIIESLTIKKFPTTKANGAGWDALPSSGPDIYVIISDNRGTLYKQTTYWADCTPTTTFAPLEFSTPLRISDIKQNITFQLWDSDSLSDEFMGGLEGSIFADNNPTTYTISSSDGQIVFDLKLTYEY